MTFIPWGRYCFALDEFVALFHPIIHCVCLVSKMSVRLDNAEETRQQIYYIRISRSKINISSPFKLGCVEMLTLKHWAGLCFSVVYSAMTIRSKGRISALFGVMSNCESQWSKHNYSFLFFLENVKWFTACTHKYLNQGLWLFYVSSA